MREEGKVNKRKRRKETVKRGRREKGCRDEQEEGETIGEMVQVERRMRRWRRR